MSMFGPLLARFDETEVGAACAMLFPACAILPKVSTRVLAAFSN